MAPRRWKIVAGVIALSMTALAASASAAPSVGPQGGDPESVLETSPKEAAEFDLDVPDLEVVEDAEALKLPAVPVQMAELADRLTRELRSSDQFGAVEISLDRTHLVIHWHGDERHALALVEKVGQGSRVEVRQTEFKPGELRSAAEGLLAGRTEVVAVAALHDGSGIRVWIDPSLSGEYETLAEVAAGLGVEAGYPVQVESGGWAPAVNRQFGVVHRLGGARIYHHNGDILDGSCTTGFSASSDANPNIEGMIFAAHCGELQSPWFVASQTYMFPYGEVVARGSANDGAVIEVESPMPLIWVGDYDSNVATPINGTSAAVINQELCYSGSYSGLVCGNIVEVVDFTYSVVGLPGLVGFLAEHIAGIPSAGNGDSGGPAYQLVSTSDGFEHHAVGVLSAIPQNSPPVCVGVPGSPLPGGRKCNSTVVSAEVVDVENELGWSVMTY